MTDNTSSIHADGENGNTAQGVFVHLDSKGAPCFAAYFDTVYQSVPQEFVDENAALSDPRLAAAFGHVIDGLAALLVQLYDNPEEAIAKLHQELVNSVAIEQAWNEQHG